jgi:hypothetical protein
MMINWLMIEKSVKGTPQAVFQTTVHSIESLYDTQKTPGIYTRQLIPIGEQIFR